MKGLLDDIACRVRDWLTGGGQFAHLPHKQRGEIAFWASEIDRYVDWYEGRLPELYGRPAPSPDDRVTGDDLQECAIRTWIATAGTKYLDALQLRANTLAERRVLDIGCGPIPHLACFENAQRWGVDQLIDEYRAIGFPLSSYDPPIDYLVGGAEAIPAEDDFFDAVLSVNAIDHVDDFPAAAREAMRVLRPGGLLRMQVHYHSPTRCEPWQLSDSLIEDAFTGLPLVKVSERPVEPGSDEIYCVWSTNPDWKLGTTTD